jgi:hypothetical protein
MTPVKPPYRIRRDAFFVLLAVFWCFVVAILLPICLNFWNALPWRLSP